MTLSGITDGTSNTAIWSEWLRGKNTNTGKQAIWTATQAFSNPGFPADGEPAVDPAGRRPDLSAELDHAGDLGPEGGRPGRSTTAASAAAYSHLLAPNKPACFFSNYNTAQYGPFPGNDDITMIGA